MKVPLTENDIRYICQSMMGVNWTPSFLGDRKVQQILSRCQSKLEVIYFLGILYYLHSNGYNGGKGRMSKNYPLCWSGTVDQNEGLWISEPSSGGYRGNGFSTLFVIPQYPSPDKEYIHHDFGLFASVNDEKSDLRFLAAIEIEGYAVHRQQRKLDEERYANLSYRVIQVFEETSEPLYWYAIFDPDVETNIIGEYLYCDKEGILHDNIALFDNYIEYIEKLPVGKNGHTKQTVLRKDHYKRGDRIFHPTFGEGVVLKRQQGGLNEIIDVQFQAFYGKKRLMVDFAKLVKLGKIPMTLDSLQ